MLDIWKLPDDQIISGATEKIWWLETSDKKSARYHIVCKHGKKFLDRGITVEKIADVIKAVTMVGHPVYYNDEL